MTVNEPLTDEVVDAYLEAHEDDPVDEGQVARMMKRFRRHFNACPFCGGEGVGADGDCPTCSAIMARPAAPAALLLSAVSQKRPCQTEGCESGKTWTRAVMGLDGEPVYLCTWCLGKLDKAGKLTEASL